MKVQRVGQISDDQFEEIGDAFLKVNGKIDQEKILRDIAGLDNEIEQQMQNLDEERAMAICILLQGRNILSLVLGQEQARAPKGVAKLLSQAGHVDLPIAIYCPEPVLARAVDCVLKNMEMGGYAIIDNMQELLDLALSDELSGVIGVSSSKYGDVLASMRHDLKHLDGWDYEKAQTAKLPPCRNWIAGQSTFLPVIFNELRSNSSENHSASDPQTENFDLRAAVKDGIDRLWPAKTPAKPLTVAVCDDNQPEVEGLLVILDAWPGVVVSYFDAESCDDAHDLAAVVSLHDIVLLDENMGKITGSEVARQLTGKAGIKCQIASISGGPTPAWAKSHFPNKNSVMFDKDLAMEFVRFMESLMSR